MKEEKYVKLIENFVSWQGEGPDSGRTMIILRFKTCNLNCPWCDTTVKMRISAEASHSLTDIQETIKERAAGLLITGGEPTVNKHLGEALLLINELDYPIANVETNGFNLFDLVENIRDDKPVKVIFSPKMFDKDDMDRTMYLLNFVNKNSNIYLKFVYEPNNVYQKSVLNHITERYKDLIWNHRVWLMPEGKTREELLKNSGPVFDACEKYNFNFSSRCHLIYDFV